MQNQPEVPQEKSVAKNALFFGAGTLTSRIFGLIRDSLVVAFIPLDMKDAWFAAFRLPNVFRRLLGEGGLSASFIPVFVKSVGQSGESKSPELRQLINGTFTLLFSLSALVCTLAIVFMDDLIPWWLQGKGFAGVPGKLAITVTMARIMFGFLLSMTLFAYFMALLNGVKKFALTGFAPVILNITIIGTLLLYRNEPDIGVYASYGVLLGGVLQAVLLVPGVIAQKLWPRFSLAAINSSGVKKVLQRFVPALLGIGVVQLMSFINIAFASTLPSGSVTYMYMADRLLELPLSLIGVSLGTALLPTLSGHWAAGRKSQFSEALMANLRLFLFLAVPAGAGLWFLGEELVQLLFVRGEFAVTEVPAVAGILKVYFLTLLSAGSLRIFNQGFYASEDTKTPALISAGGLVLHCLMAGFWMEKFGLEGLCFSTALTVYINLKISAAIAERRFRLPHKKEFLIFFVKTFLATAAMVGFLLVSKQMILLSSGLLLATLSLLMVVGAAVVLYFVAGMVLSVPEAQMVARRLKGRFLS